jgi:hypothetical protein
LALRTINPNFNLSSDPYTEYIMDPTNFQETLAHNTTIQKTLKEAAIRRSKQVFSRDCSQGSFVCSIKKSAAFQLGNGEENEAHSLPAPARTWILGILDEITDLALRAFC